MTRAPIAASMRSVWSRVTAGSTTVVGPSSAKSPARRIADFTWALATGSSYSIGMQPAAANRQRRVALGRFDARAHLAQRHGDPLLRPRRERLVADERELALLAGEDARDEAHQRAGVAAVERLGGRDEPAQPAPVHPHDVVGDVDDLDTELTRDGDRRLRVGGATEAADLGFAVGDRAEQDAALADPLHARHLDRAAKRDERLDEQSFVDHRRRNDAVALRLEQRHRRARPRPRRRRGR